MLTDKSRKAIFLGWRILLALIIIFFTLLMVRLTLPYLDFGRKVDFLLTKYKVYHIDAWRWGFRFHIFSSILVLLAGAIQFNGYMIRKWPRVHRVAGYIYVIVVVFISGPGAFIMAIYANGGLPAQSSFILLTVLWISFTVTAWIYARKRQFVIHGEYMIRSYALTFSAVTLRILVFLFVYFQVESSPKDRYITVAWLSWVPNMIIGEILIKAGLAKKLMRRR